MVTFVGACAVIAFWSFLAVCAVAGMIYDYRKKQLAIETLRIAVEHGQNIEPAVIQALLSQQKGTELNPAALQVAGIITTSAAVGVFLLGLCLLGIAPIAIWPTLGAGAITLCTGIGLLIAGRVVARNQAHKDSQRVPA